jgi:hypothetical protein
VPAVRAVPVDLGSLAEDGARLEVLEGLAEAGLVVLLDVGQLGEEAGDRDEPLLLGLLRHPDVHVGPLHVLARDARLEIRVRGGEQVEELEHPLGVLLLLLGRRLEDLRDLEEPRLAGLAREESVLVAGHRLARERFLEVLLRLRPCQLSGHV